MAMLQESTPVRITLPGFSLVRSILQVEVLGESENARCRQDDKDEEPKEPGEKRLHGKVGLKQIRRSCDDGLPSVRSLLTSTMHSARSCLLRLL